MLDQSAMAVAADALGYPGASEVIERDPARSVAETYRMFRLGRVRIVDGLPLSSCWQPPQHGVIAISSPTIGTGIWKRRWQSPHWISMGIGGYSTTPSRLPA